MWCLDNWSCDAGGCHLPVCRFGVDPFLHSGLPASDRARTAEAALSTGPLTCCVQTTANTSQHGFALTHFAAFILLGVLTGKSAHFCWCTYIYRQITSEACTAGRTDKDNRSVPVLCCAVWFITAFKHSEGAVTNHFPLIQQSKIRAGVIWKPCHYSSTFSSRMPVIIKEMTEISWFTQIQTSQNGTTQYKLKKAFATVITKSSISNVLKASVGGVQSLKCNDSRS